ncbi:MAG: DNA photolyase [Desulfobacterales bacterium]|nr:DNA photolyase [Desulfobacterales bacterium]
MKINRLFIDADLNRDHEIEYLISKIGREPETISDSREIYDLINAADDPITFAKSILYITRNRGAVVRECPGTSIYTCCDYTILHTGTFCTMDCSYCILQAYFHPPVLQYFAGLDILSDALDEAFGQNKILRIGTGEYTDSLIWEPVSLMPAFLVEKFAGQNNAVLELKTKTVNVGSLMDLDHNGKTILAWSVNTPEVIRSEEKGTAALAARLATARDCAAKGYKLAFHFDPLVIYPDCEVAYAKVIRTIFEHVSPEDVVWISIGTFRFMPQLKPIVEQRFPDSTIPYGEFILGLDNKMRYFKPLRIDLYRKLVTVLRDVAPDVLVYYCMEDQEVWEKTMGFFPAEEGELGRLLDKAAADKCGLDHRLL